MVIKILKIKTDFKRDSKMEDSEGHKDFEEDSNINSETEAIILHQVENKNAEEENEKIRDYKVEDSEAHKDFENKKRISKETLKWKIVKVIKILKIKTDFNRDYKM